MLCSAKILCKGKKGKEKVVTDAGGYFEFDELKKGSYKITVSKKGYKKYKQRVMLEGEELGKIFWYTYDIDGKPIEEVHTTLKGVKTGSKLKEYTNGKGFFEFEDLDPVPIP